MRRRPKPSCPSSREPTANCSSSLQSKMWWSGWTKLDSMTWRYCKQCATRFSPSLLSMRVRCCFLHAHTHIHRTPTSNFLSIHILLLVHLLLEHLIHLITFPRLWLSYTTFLTLSYCLNNSTLVILCSNCPSPTHRRVTNTTTPRTPTFIHVPLPLHI